MIDSKGYMKLINLSTSKIIRTENNQMSKTFTIIGTPHYMAPDIILGKGYKSHSGEALRVDRPVAGLIRDLRAGRLPGARPSGRSTSRPTTGAPWTESPAPLASAVSCLGCGFGPRF